MAQKKLTLKDVIKLETAKCIDDPIYFMKKYCKIQHPIKGTIPFHLYPYQEETLDSFHHNRYNIVLKSRQTGISTLSAGFSLWNMLFKSDFNVLVIATKQDVAKNLVQKVRFMHENLPSWLKEETVADNKLSLFLRNGSQIKAISSSPDAGRSEALSLLIFDEAAFIEDIDEIWTSAQPTLSCLDKNTLITTDKGIFRIFDFFDTNMKEGFNDLKLNIVNKYGEVELADSFYISPKSKVLKFTFEDGNSIITTKNHPLLTDKGWCIADELKIGTEVKSIFNTQKFGKKIKYPVYTPYNNRKNENLISDNVTNDDLAYFYGLYIAEGNRGNKKVHKNPSIHITNTDEDVIEFITNKFGFKRNDDRHFSLFSTHLSSYMKFVGIDYSTAKFKKIPNKILSASKQEQVKFLKGLFDGDGCAIDSRSIKYASASHQLITDLYTMLLNFGIRSRIKKEEGYPSESSVVANKNKKSVIYNLMIYGKYADVFYNEIGFGLDRKQSRQFKNKRDNGLLVEVADKSIVKSLIQKSGFSFRRFRKYATLDRYLFTQSNKMSESNLKSILDNTDSELNEWSDLEAIYQQFNSNFFFNKIVKIEELDDERVTYDFKVPNTHSFIGNSIVNHNTGGMCIALSTPYGVGNWFHKTWVEAENGDNLFSTIKLHWTVHPERDQEWRDEQERQLGPKKAKQECLDGEHMVSVMIDGIETELSLNELYERLNDA